MSQETKTPASTNAVKLVPIMVYVQKKKNTQTGIYYPSYRTKMELEVIENGESKGIEIKYVDVKFTNAVKDAWKGKLNRGLYYVPATKLSAPKKYEIVPDAKNPNKMIYPEVWIREIDHIKEIAYVPEFNSFVTDEEPETEETEIGESLPFDE